MEILEIRSNCQEKEDIGIMLVILCVYILIAWKIFLMRIHRDVFIQDIINGVKKDWIEQTDETYRDIMRKRTQMGRRVCYFAMFSVMIVCSLHVTLMMPLNTWIENDDTLRQYPLLTSCIFNSVSDPVYRTMFIFQVVLIFVTCPTYAVEAFFLGITMHLSGQFEIIKLEIHKIGHDEKVNGEGKKIEAIINNHIHLLKTSMYLENVFNSQILLQLLASSILVCISGYQLIASVESGDGAMLVKNIGLITVMLLQPLIYCFAGDHLSSQSEGVKHAAYNCPWYNLSAKHAKDILFIIRRADIPVKLTAGKFVTMSLSQYLDVIKTAASYMSFLRVTYS